MRIISSIFFILLFQTSWLAFANPEHTPVFKTTQEFTKDGSRITLDQTVEVVSGPDGLHEVMKRFVLEMQESPDGQVSVQVVLPPTVVVSEIPSGKIASIFPKIREKVSKYLGNNLYVSVSRAIVNGVGLFICLTISPQIAFDQALPIAATMGAISGSIQYKLIDYHQWLENSNAWLEKQILHFAEKLKKLKLGKQTIIYSKFYLTEVAFIGLSEVLASVSGVPLEPVAKAFTKLLWTAFVSTIGQGMWERSLRENLIQDQAHEVDPIKRNWLESLFRIKTAAISFAAVSTAVTAAIANSLGFEHGQVGLWIFAGSGLVKFGWENYLTPQQKTWIKSHAKKLVSFVTNHSTKCEAFLL